MKINIHIFLFIIVALIAALNDIIIYLFNIQYNIALFLSAILIVCFFIFLVKKKKVFELKTDFDKEDLFFIIPAIALAILVFMSTDINYDVTNYHYILQDNPFGDKLNFDFLPGRTYNSFLFPLGDRMHFIFRQLFGLRFGRILSAYALIIVFYQTKRILKELYDLPKKKLIILSVGMAIITPFLDKMFTYYIDNFSCILLFELVHIFLIEKNIFKEKKYLYIFVLITGLATAIKLPNIIMAFGIFIGIVLNNSIVDKKFKLIDNLKQLKIYDYLLLILLFFCPFFIYMVDNFHQTGSVIYPYYNKIFKSPYFSNINWIDEKFGMENFWETLVFPIIIAFNPKSGNDGVCGMGLYLIAYAICLCTTILQDRNTLRWKISALGTFLTVLWLNFLMAYTRYAIIVPIIFVLIEYDLLISFDLKEKYKSLMKQDLNRKAILEFTISSVILAAVVINFFEGGLYAARIAADYSVIADYSYYKENRKNEKIHIDGVWVSLSGLGALTSLVREESVPIYNLDREHLQGSEKLLEKYYEIIEDHGDELYMIIPSAKHMFYNACRKMWQNNFKIERIVDIYKNPAYQNEDEIWYICKIKYYGEIP